MLTPFAENLWIADGAVAEVAGFRYPTRMAVVRLADGGLWIWSAVGLTPELQAEVSALGPVRHIVVPCANHTLHVAAWQAAFDQARTSVAPGVRRRAPGIRVDCDLQEGAPTEWAGQIDQSLMPNRIAPEVVFFHRASGTLLFTDLLQGFAPGWFAGWRGVIAWLDAMTGPEPATPRKFRLATTDRNAARAALAHLRQWPVERVLMAHGTPVTRDAPAYLDRAFRWLTG